MACGLIATGVIMITFQQYVTCQFTDKWSRFEKHGHVLDIDSQYSSLLETLSDLSLNECARVAAFNPLLLWFVYNSDRRECSTSRCWDIPTEVQPNSNNVLYRKHGASAPRSCSDVKAEVPDEEDGEYLVYPGAFTFLGCPTKIYCHNMITDNPSEYVSLPAINMGVYPDRYNNLCIGETAFDSVTYNPGNTFFSKIAIDVNSMIVNINDYTFANSNGTRHPYAVARDCYNGVTHPECGPVGTFHINTVGTGMIVNMQQTWSAEGWLAFTPSVTRSADGREIDLLCGGVCGGCIPDGDLELHRDPLGGLVP